MRVFGIAPRPPPLLWWKRTSWQRRSRRPRGARLLDIPCGSGRHSVELAQRGYPHDGHRSFARFFALGPSARCRRSRSTGLAPCRRCVAQTSTRMPSMAPFCFGNKFSLSESYRRNRISCRAQQNHPARRQARNRRDAPPKSILPTPRSAALAPLRRHHRHEQSQLRRRRQPPGYRLYVHPSRARSKHAPRPVTCSPLPS